MTDSAYKLSRSHIRVIRSRTDYDQTRRDLEHLLDLDPPSGSPDRDRLEVLLVLLADYEAREAPPPRVDPVDAIRFRMDQLGLKPRDLEPYLGGRSRVSEVLGRKRSLSITMIRALHEGLGIPAEALIKPAVPSESNAESAQIPWERFPIREMATRGWVQRGRTKSWTREAARELLQPFFMQAGSRMVEAPLHRRSAHMRTAKKMDDYALAAWTARVLHKAQNRIPTRAFEPRVLDAKHVRELVQLSRLDDGPRRAQEWLAVRGIVMVVEANLPRTRLDGAALRTENGTPIIALTIRYDRLDNFWFTLLHECAHIALHLAGAKSPAVTEYFDDLEVADKGDTREREADTFARESLVPSALWKASAVGTSPSVATAVALAEAIGVSPAVVAGRARRDKRNFRLLGALVGVGEVRRQFPEVRFDL